MSRGIPIVVPTDTVPNPEQTGTGFGGETCTCPDGFYYDAIQDLCVNEDDDSITVDPICYPTDTGTTTSPTGTTTTGTATGGPVNVNLQQTINLAQQSLDSVTNAVEQGIEEGANQASSIAKDTANAVSSAVSGLVQTVTNTAQGFFGGIWQIIQQIGSQIGQIAGNLLQSITSGIASAIQQIGSTLASAFGPIVSAIGQFIQNFQQYYQSTIQPIFSAISQGMQTISATISAVERDIHDGFTGLLNLPGDISNGLSSLEGTIQRLSDQLGINLNQVVTTTIGGTNEDTIWTRLKAMGDGLTGIPGYSNLATTFQASVKLPEPSITQAGSATIAALWQELEAVATSIVSGGQGTLDGLASTLPIVSTILGATAGTAPYLVSLTAAAVAVFWPYFEFVKGDIASKAGLAKLDPKSALEAWLRGFIDTQTMQAELGFTGLDTQRIQALQDLTNYLIDNKDALDMWFRGIINDDDLLANASAHGISSTDLSALQGAAYKLFSVATATTAFQWGAITEQQLDDALQENRYTDNEITAYKAVLWTPESSDQVVTRLRITNLYAGLGFSPDGFSDVPTDLSSAVSREGANAQVALDKWQASYWVPPLDFGIEAYWRGVMSIGQLNGVMDYYAVPVSMRTYLLATKSALIPYRTIPTMLANGIITETYAKQQLAAHGFDLNAQEALLGYASITKAKSKTAQLGNPLLTSISAAKQLWTIGAFSDSDYTTALEAHGYTAEQAALVIQAEKIAEEAADRKQVATDIVNEVLAGLITIDDAKSQMAAQQFTMAETAKVLKSIARVQRSTSKTPSEAELTKMVKGNAITFSAWQTAMAVLGYAQNWIDAYAVLNFGSANGPQTLSLVAPIGQ